MDWYPLYNSLRIALISTVIIFFAGIAAAYYVARLPRVLKGVLDVLFTLPLVLPPTVVGYLLLRVLGPKRAVGAWALAHFDLKLTMVWWSAIFATTVVIFPLMYRTARGAFESFDETLADAGRTLGLLEHMDLLAGAHARLQTGHPCGHGARVRACARRVRRNIHGGGLHARHAPRPFPRRSISSWRTNDDALAFKWVVVNLAISAVVLLAVNLLEKRERGVRKAWH